MTDGTFKYLRFGVSLTPGEEAYDLSVDPLEVNDLWPSFPTLPPATQAALLALKNDMINLSGF
jgi:hypothetical protein